MHLDTNIVIAHLNGDEAVWQHWDAATPNVAISSVVLGELLFGMKNSNRANRNLSRLNDLIKEVPIVTYDRACAEKYSDLRFSLKRQGRPCGDADMMIAATALVHDAILVTRNVRHFEPVSGLAIEPWLKGPK